jgi:hypothetical protein
MGLDRRLPLAPNAILTKHRSTYFDILFAEILLNMRSIVRSTQTMVFRKHEALPQSFENRTVIVPRIDRDGTLPRKQRAFHFKPHEVQVT